MNEPKLEIVEVGDGDQIVDQQPPIGTILALRGGSMLAYVMPEAITALREHLNEGMVTRLEKCLDRCNDLFSEIRMDFSDPRDECEEGQRVIKEALSILVPAELGE